MTIAVMEREKAMNDYISRQAAIEVMCGQCYVSNPNTCDTRINNTKWCPEVYALQNAPPADVRENKRGKWHSRFYSKIEMIICSECQSEFSYDAETGLSDYNFCPICGADMRGRI